MSSLLNGIVAYYRLDGDLVDLISANNGTNMTAAFDSSGKINSCALFAGANRMTIPNAAQLQFTSAMSISFWMNSSTSASGKYFLAKPTVISSSNGYDVNTGSAANKLRAFLIGLTPDNFEVNASIYALVVYFRYTNENYQYFIAVSILCFLGYLIGEMSGWGLWVGTLTNKLIDTWYLHTEREGGWYTGIQRLTEYLIEPTKENWIDHCRLALFLRGVWWASWMLLPLLLVDICPTTLILAIIVLGVAFPVSCDSQVL